MIGLQKWWKMAVLSVGLLSASKVLAADGYGFNQRVSTGRRVTSQRWDRAERSNPFATTSATDGAERRTVQRVSAAADPGPSEDGSGQADVERSAHSGRPEEETQTAQGEKTAFFGCGWGFGCYPCRPACRPACPPVSYGCPSPYPAPVGYYGGGYGGGCAPVGGCYPPPAPAGGFYSGPVLPPAISSPVIGAPVGYYGGGYGGGYPGYGSAGYGAPGYGASGYGAPGYGYPVYGEARSSNETQAPSQWDREQTGKTRAVSRLLQDGPRNPFAD